MRGTRHARLVLLFALGAGALEACDSDEASPEVSAGGASGAGGGAAASGSAGTDAAAGSAGISADGGPDCAAELAGFLKFVHANKSCTTADDCAIVHSCGAWNWPHEECNGDFFLNESYDVAGWAAVSKAYDACAGGCKGVGCGMFSKPGQCWHGQCWRGYPSPDELDQCVAEQGGDAACTVCLCGTCTENDCGSDTDCTNIYLCALAAGCLGKPECEPTDPNFACKSEVNKVGGAISPSALRYHQLNQCVANRGCSVICQGS